MAEVKIDAWGQFMLSKARVVQDWPKDGVSFIDFFPFLAEPSNLYGTCARTVAKIAPRAPEAIFGIEARGFVLGAALANYMGVKFIPLRKPGKLPPPVYAVEYETEYSKDELEAPRWAERSGVAPRALVIDDVLATGGTAKAASDLVAFLGYDPEWLVVLWDVSIGGREKVAGHYRNLVVLSE